jgi:hypothetical protein
MNSHHWPLALLPFTAIAFPAMAYDVQSDQHPAQFDQHTDWAYTDASTPEALHYRPWHFQIEGGPAITQRAAAEDLDNGWNAGAGFTWYPTRYLPFGVRGDATYSRFDARQPLLDAASAATGANISDGTRERWGGDLDGEFDIPITPSARLYLLAGVGWYKSQSTYRQTSQSPALVCSWWGCVNGYVTETTTASQSTTKTQFARNLGLGMEFGTGPGTSFFVEARYMRLGPANQKQDFIPVHFGLRF